MQLSNSLMPLRTEPDSGSCATFERVKLLSIQCNYARNRQAKVAMLAFMICTKLSQTSLMPEIQAFVAFSANFEQVAFALEWL